MKIVLDIETNSTHDKIWMAATRELLTDKVIVWKEASGLQKYLEHCDLIIGHNLIAFDAPVLRKVWKVTMKLSQVYDTLVASRLLSPSLEGGHSLEAWGQRLGFPKGDFSDWDAGYSIEMETYCIQDTLVTAKLYSHLVLTLQSQGFSLQSIGLEHEVQAIITKQTENGFKLDEPKACLLLATLRAKLDAIQSEMQKVFPDKVETNRISKLNKPLKDIVTPFNPGSRAQIAERLMERGWKPSKRTEKGAVIVDEAVLAELDYPEAKFLAEYMMLQKRIAQIESWLDALGQDGRVHGRVITCGAITNRMTHMSPNMAQVPNSGSPYGHECRELWTVEKGNALVGIDASGLELRMLAHYMNDPKYTHEVVSGDIHTANMNAAGLTDRNQAKTFIYAWLYGAGSAKIGSIVGGTAKAGQKLIDSFLTNTPAIGRLKSRVQDAYSQRQCLNALDGRKLLCRSEHSALNTLLQGAGAIVMKKALAIFNKKLHSLRVPHQFVANVHDEWQVEVPQEYAELVGRLGVEAIEDAGVALKMRCPLTGEFKVGNNWKETH
jgi:DNA polymerase I-like protein with 3'-5' exonuclease and polymerase domains